MSPLVRLLPSGPDRVPKLSLRENQSLPLNLDELVKSSALCRFHTTYARNKRLFIGDNLANEQYLYKPTTDHIKRTLTLINHSPNE